MKKIFLIFIMMFFLTSCNQISKNIISTEDSFNALENSTEMRIEKALISLNASYDVYIDNVKIGNVSGKFINVTGDTFTFKNINGEILSKEKQIKRWGVKLNRSAEICNEDDEIVGYIGEEKIKDLLKWGYRFYFYDKDKIEIAYTKEIFFSLLPKYEIYNLDDELVCTINAQFSINNKYEITIEENNHLPKDQIIFFTCIIDAIKTSDDNKDK